MSDDETVFDTALGRLTTTSVQIARLRAGDRVVTAGGRRPIVFEVVAGPALHPEGWPTLRDLTSSDAELVNVVEPGANPRMMVLSLSPDVFVYRVVADKDR